MKTIKILIFIATFWSLANAQISIVDSGASGNQVNLGAAYTQSFDSLANTTTAPVAWVNNGTLRGWYAYQKSTGDVIVYNPSQGSTSDFASFGILGDSDRALGSGLNGGQADTLYFGVQFVNNSSLLVEGLDISFDGEQWYYGTRFPGISESLVFSYQVFDAGQGGLSVATGWSQINDLLFTSPKDSGSPVRQALNGNLSANRVEGIADSLAGLMLAPGEELWLRWEATNNLSITDDALAIDNLSVRFTAVPEPATYGALAGGIVLLVAARRRRR